MTTLPILNFLLEHAENHPVSFHMPGHKGSAIYRRFGYEPFLTAIMDCDITEIPGADNLFQTEGILKAAQEEYAKLYGAKRSYLLINGTSGGVIAAVMAAVPKGKKLVMARNSHKAIFNSLVLAGVEPVYAYPEMIHEYGISGVITPEEIERCLAENPDAEAVILPSPNYYGICSDIQAIADVVHARGKVLIVDQAHGAHLKFFSDAGCAIMPKSAEEQGADITVNSIHKTLASFTQSALLNLNSDRHPRGSPTDPAAPGHAPCLHELPARYAGHEVAVHGCGHETWGVVPPAVTLEDVLRCRRDLESVFRRPILGLAYPCGYSSKSPRIDEILRACGIIYARTIEAEDPYALPEDFFDWAPTSHHNGRRGRSLADIGREFLALCPETVAVCYIWGHSFEFPARNNWEVLEDFCTLLDNHPEIWRVTNRELYDYTHAVRSLVRLEGGCVLCNPMAMPVCGFVGKRPVVLRPCSLIECCLPDVQR